MLLRTFNPDTGDYEPEVPFWFETINKPCNCNQFKAVNIKTGHSDNTYIQYACIKCGHKWCHFMEG
jgi:hypothetical protein